MWKLGPVCLCWDFGWNHPCLVVFQDRDYGRFDQIVILGAWLGDRELLRLFAGYIMGRVQQMLPNAEFLSFCDPAGAQKSNQGVTDQSAVDILESLGVKPRYMRSDVEYGVNLMADLLASNYTYGRSGVQPLLLIDDNEFTQDVIDGFEIGYVQDPRAVLEDKMASEGREVRSYLRRPRYGISTVAAPGGTTLPCAPSVPNGVMCSPGCTQIRIPVGSTWKTREWTQACRATIPGTSHPHPITSEEG